MTPEQQSACESHYPNLPEPECECCKQGFEWGFKAAQTPEMLILNPLVKGLVEAVDDHFHRQNGKQDDLLELKRFRSEIIEALAPFTKEAE